MDGCHSQDGFDLAPDDGFARLEQLSLQIVLDPRYPPKRVNRARSNDCGAQLGARRASRLFGGESYRSHRGIIPVNEQRMKGGPLGRPFFVACFDGFPATVHEKQKKSAGCPAL